MAQETLGLRRRGFSPRFSLLIPGFSLPWAPRRLPLPASPPTQRSPTKQEAPKGSHFHSFGGWLESRPFSAQAHLTGELLRTL